MSSQSAIEAPTLSGLVQISRNIRALLALRLAEIGLSVGEDEMLVSMAPHQSTTAGNLAGKFHLSMSNVNRIMESLVRKSVIEPLSPGIYLLTSHGEATRAKVLLIHNSIETELTLGTADPVFVARIGDLNRSVEGTLLWTDQPKLTA